MAGIENTQRKFKLCWFVENYFSLYVNNEESTSPKIVAENLDSSEWYIRLIPNRDEEHILCYLNQLSKIVGDKKFFVDYECNFTNVDGDILKSEIGAPQYFSKKSDCVIIDMDQFSDKFQNLFVCFTLKSEPQGVSNEPQNHLAVGCEIKTKVNIKRCAFRWNIRNRSSARSQNKKVFNLYSSRFEIDLTKSSDLYTIVIRQLDEKSPENVKGKITFLNLQGINLGSEIAAHDFSDGIWKFPNIISISNLEAQGITIPPNEMLTVACRFTTCVNSEPNEHVKYTFNTQAILPVVEEPYILDEDVQYLLSLTAHWDVLLQIENKALPAHKHVLALHSPVFSAMFEHDMLENQRGVVKIPNKDVETLKLFLNFIYLEKIECVTYDSYVKLLIVAHEYQVSGLIEECVNFLISLLSVRNVCESLVLANMYELTQLKENALDYVIDNYVHFVLRPEWSKWLGKNKQFSSEFLSKLSLKLENVYSTYQNEQLIKPYKDSQEKLYEFISTLLKCGGDPNICFKFNDTFLGVVTGLRLNKISLLLLQSGVHPTYYDLVRSLRNGDLATIEAHLQHGAPVASNPTLCESALHCLNYVDYNVIEVCRLLVKYGADVDFENECYNTPLFFAVGNAAATLALLHYGAQPCYKCPRGSPLERSFDLAPKIVQNMVKYAALYVKHQLDSEMSHFFQNFKEKVKDNPELKPGKPYLKFAQQCMAEINVLKNLKVDRERKSLFDLAVSQGKTLKSFHDDPSIIREVNIHLKTSSVSIYQEVLEKKLNKDYLI